MSRLQWQRRRILIWGKTRPDLSAKYREIVCTGGVFGDTKRLVRIYPVPLRYLDDEKVFKKYQWIEAEVARNVSDARPESYRIAPDGITVGAVIAPGRANWDARAEWVMHPENVFASVEALQTRQRHDKTSLGLVKPAEVIGVRAVRTPEAERREFSARYEEATRQMDLPVDPDTGREIKPLRAADFRYKVRFRCDEAGCDGHDLSILDWEIDALYHRYRSEREFGPQQAAEVVVAHLRDKVFADDKDVHLFLGNFAAHPTKFSVVGLWRPKKKPVEPQRKLF